MRRAVGSKFLRVGAAIVALIVLGCSDPGTRSPTDRPPSTEQVQVGTTQLFGVEWKDEKTLVVVYTPDDDAISRLATVELANPALVDLPAPVRPTCESVILRNPARLPDGTLGLSNECVAPVGSGRATTTELLSFDFSTGGFASLANLGDLAGPAGQFTTSPDGTRTVAAMGSLCGVIVEADQHGYQPLDVRVTADGQSYNLSDIERGPDCGGRGWAAQPTWSPDGTEVAFFAAPSAIGEEGPVRADAPASLFVMNDGANIATAILGPVLLPRGLRYSPDGSRLAFAGQVNGDRGTWTLDRATGHLTKLTELEFDWLAWSPDAKRIAGLYQIDPNQPLDNRLVVVDVPDL